MQNKKIVKIMNEKGEYIGTQYGDEIYIPKDYTKQGINDLFALIQKEQPDFAKTYKTDGLIKKNISNSEILEIADNLHLYGKNERLTVSRKDISTNEIQLEDFDEDNELDEPKKTKKKNNTLKYVAAGIGTIAVIAGIAAGCNAIKVHSKVDDTDSNSSSSSSTLEKKYSEAELTAMNINELVEVYKANVYDNDVMQNLYNAQSATNSAFSGVKLQSDGNAQLHLTSNEVFSLFNVVNADRLSAEDFMKIYGNTSKYMNAAKDGDTVKEIYGRIASYYYRLVAEKDLPLVSLNLSNYFTNESDKELINNWETKTIDLIKTLRSAKTSDEAKIALESYHEYNLSLGDFDQSNTNEGSKIYTNKGPMAIIYSVSPAIIQTADVWYGVDVIETKDTDKDDVHVTSDDLDQYQTIGGDLHCTLVDNVEQIQNKVTIKEYSLDSEETEQSTLIIDYIKLKMDIDNVQKYGINDETENHISIINTKDLTKLNNLLNSSNVTTPDRIITTPGTKKPVTREEAVAAVGEEEVKEKEDEAESKVEQQNKDEEERAAGVLAGYNAYYAQARDYTMRTGTRMPMPSYSASGSTAYQKGYYEGVSTAINNGFNDGYPAYQAAQKPSTVTPSSSSEVPGTPDNQTPNSNSGEIRDPEYVSSSSTPASSSSTPASSSAPVVTPSSSSVEKPVDPSTVVPDSDAGEIRDPDFLANSSTTSTASDSYAEEQESNIINPVATAAIGYVRVRR